MAHLRLHGLVLPIALLLLALCACSRSPPPPAEQGSSTAAQAGNVEWARFVDEFIESHFAAQPAFAVAQGRHEFDGQLPDWSAAGIEKEIARVGQARERAAAFQDAVLSTEERFQREYLLSRIDNDLFWLRDARQPYTNPAWYFDAGLDPGTYVSVPYAPADQRLRALIKYLKQI